MLRSTCDAPSHSHPVPVPPIPTTYSPSSPHINHNTPSLPNTTTATTTPATNTPIPAQKHQHIHARCLLFLFCDASHESLCCGLAVIVVQVRKWGFGRLLRARVREREEGGRVDCGGWGRGRRVVDEEGIWGVLRSLEGWRFGVWVGCGAGCVSFSFSEDNMRCPSLSHSSFLPKREDGKTADTGGVKAGECKDTSAGEHTYECLRFAWPCDCDCDFSASSAWTAVLKRFQKLGSWTMVANVGDVRC